MVWTIEYTRSALTELKKIDKREARRIGEFMTDRVGLSDNPRILGKALTGNLGEFWRYRVGNYRIIAEIHDQKIRILVVRVGHRKDIYR